MQRVKILHLSSFATRIPGEASVTLIINQITTTFTLAIQSLLSSVLVANEDEWGFSYLRLDIHSGMEYTGLLSLLLFNNNRFY